PPNAGPGGGDPESQAGATRTLSSAWRAAYVSVPRGSLLSSTSWTLWRFGGLRRPPEWNWTAGKTLRWARAAVLQSSVYDTKSGLVRCRVEHQGSSWIVDPEDFQQVPAAETRRNAG